MLKNLLTALLFMTGLSACSAGLQKAYAETLSSETRKWRFEKYHCAFGCSLLFEKVVAEKIGQILDFDKPQTGFDLFTECEGKLSLKTKTVSQKVLMDQLNETIDPAQKYNSQNTGLNKRNIQTAQAICESNGKSSSTFWVVSLEPEKIIVYYEDSSFLHFSAFLK